MFSPLGNTNVDRPFEDAVVNSFDFDFESILYNLPVFSTKLRSLIDVALDKTYYLSATPQYKFPDAALSTTLNTVAFNLIMV